MARWQRGLPWIGGGILVAAAGIAAGVAGDNVGGAWSTALFGPLFWLGITAAPLLMVWGAVVLMDGFDRLAAASTAGLAVLGFIVAVVLHNVIYGITGVEEAFFFTLATLVSPVVLLAAIIRFFLPAHHGPTRDDGPPARRPPSTASHAH